MDQRRKDHELPPDDGSAEHDMLRLRRALRSRTDENARRIMDANDRLHVVQLRATRAKLPEEQVLALTQALRHACEMHVLTMNDVAHQVERLVSAGTAATELGTAVDRLERSVQQWGERLAKTEEVGSGQRRKCRSAWPSRPRKSFAGPHGRPGGLCAGQCTWESF